MTWEKDSPLVVVSTNLFDGAQYWINGYDPSQLKYLSDTAFMTEMQEWFGEAQSKRDNIKDDTKKSGYRKGPTIRFFPSRVEAAKSALEKNFIAKKEYEQIISSEATEENKLDEVLAKYNKDMDVSKVREEKEFPKKAKNSHTLVTP